MNRWEDATDSELRSYILGATRDGTPSRAHNTFRIGQSDRTWLEAIQCMLARIDLKSWIYREGRSRNYWVLETTAPFVFRQLLDFPLRMESLAFARGYFDADGGMPRHLRARLYFQFVQKNREDLSAVRDLLMRQGIACGVLHNPSIRVDPSYWRFFIWRGPKEISWTRWDRGIR